MEGLVGVRSMGLSMQPFTEEAGLGGVVLASDQHLTGMFWHRPMCTYRTRGRFWGSTSRARKAEPFKGPFCDLPLQASRLPMWEPLVHLVCELQFSPSHVPLSCAQIAFLLNVGLGISLEQDPSRGDTDISEACGFLSHPQ